MNTKQIVILWAGALLITFLMGYINAVTDPDFPVNGTIGINGKKVSYHFEKKDNIDSLFNIIIRTDADSLSGNVRFSRHNNSDTIFTIELSPSKGSLSASVPVSVLPSVSRYRIILERNNKQFLLPPTGEMETKLFRKVPKSVTTTYFILLFGGMLLGIRAGLEYFSKNKNEKKLALFAVMSISVATILFYPVQRFIELGVINRKVLTPAEMYDLSMLGLAVLWMVGTVLMFKSVNSKRIALITAIISVIYFVFAV